MKSDPEAELVWTACAQAIRDQVSDVVWQTTFSGARARAFDQRSLVLVVPTSLQKARIERRYFDLLTDAVDETTPNLTVRIEIDPDLAELDHNRLGDGHGVSAPACAPEADGAEPSADGRPDMRLTFEHFVMGASNRFSHAAALAVAEAPAGAYNPLFIYGGPGLGKTHLLRAIAHYVGVHYPVYRVRYVTSETILNDFVRAIRESTQPQFQAAYRKNRVLLVDDVQFMAGKDGLQEEFFHTFNDLLRDGAQVVLSSDRAPDAIPTLEDRLRSRFKSGLITDIQPPDLVTRLAILEKKTESFAPNIPREVLSFIAENIRDSIRELEGALIKVTAYASITGQRCSHELAKRVLADVISSTGKAPVTARTILDAASEIFGLPLEQIIGGSRRRPLVDARQIAMYVARSLTDLSYPEIGRAFGDRDHTTVIHAVRKIERHMTEHRETFDLVQKLQERVSRPS